MKEKGKVSMAYRNSLQYAFYSMKKFKPLKIPTLKIGTILPSTTPFGTASSDNLTRANRKRTLVDELVDDAEAKRYAKKKFEDLQSVRGARGRNTLHAKLAMRRGKW
jgi:hypothetical protein